MNKKLVIILKTILVAIVIINFFGMNNKLCAEGFKAEGFKDVSEEVENWAPVSKPGNVLGDKVSIIVTLVRTVGILISVGTLMVIGIKFMLGSVEEKAVYKQTLLPWLVGAILVFAITAIPSMLYDATKETLEKENPSTQSPTKVPPKPFNNFEYQEK